MRLTQFAIFYVREDGSAVLVPQNEDDYQRAEKVRQSLHGAVRFEAERRVPHPCWKSRN